MIKGIKPDSAKNGTGVVFSSGFFGFFAHAGVLAAIRESGLQPTGYAGTSSGAIVAAMAACNMPDEEIRGILFSLRKRDFWDPDSPGALLPHLLRGFRGWTGYLRGRGFARLLERIPAKRIEDCITPLVVAATDLTLGKEAVLAEGDLVRAIHASGAVPGLFKPVRISGSWCVDGGMVDKAPVRALAEHIQPARILVHYMASDNLAARSDNFLAKRFTPWHIHSLSVNIARRVSYEHQCAFVRGQGIEVVEVRTCPPALGPNRLSSGPSAYAHGRKETLRFLAGLEPL
ncbi:MAG: patatin-like phospholipase family protein [Thermodesulfobacteriota bacterium]